MREQEQCQEVDRGIYSLGNGGYFGYSIGELRERKFIFVKYINVRVVVRCVREYY